MAGRAEDAYDNDMSLMGNLGISLLLLFCSATALAHPITMRALGINSEVLYETTIDVEGLNLGQLTDQTFSAALANRDLTDYTGEVQGVLSIDHLGNGLEVISSTEMNAYGWCYRINGTALYTLANQYQFTGREQVVEWFYAYSHLSGSDWSQMCTPATHVPPPCTHHLRHSRPYL